MIVKNMLKKIVGEITYKNSKLFLALDQGGILVP